MPWTTVCMHSGMPFILTPIPEGARTIYIYAPRKKKLTMKVTKIRPDIEDPLEPPEGSLSDFIVIQIDEGEVSYKSSLEDEKALFYIDLCKHIILRDWLGDGHD